MSSFQIPAGVEIINQPHCEGCGREVDVRDPQLRRRIDGWVRPRKRGIHGVELMRYDEGRYLCDRCTTERKAGIFNQESLDL